MPELIREWRIAMGAAMRELSVGQGKRRGMYQERLREAVARELAAGLRLRRDFYHVEASPASARMGRLQMQAPGKENIPPKSVPRQAHIRKSPLPDWYPRTPLRDITTLLDEMERRRASLRSTAARKRRNQHAELSPSSALAVTPFPQKLRASATDTNHHDASDTATHCTPIPSVTCFPAMKSSSPRTPLVPGSSIVEGERELIERELKLEKSIDAIEELVRQDLKRKPKVKKAKRSTQQKTLMSLR